MDHDVRASVLVHRLNPILRREIVVTAAWREDGCTGRLETPYDLGAEEARPARHRHGLPRPGLAHGGVALRSGTGRSRPAAASSASTIERTSSSKLTVGFHPSFVLALDASPTRIGGSTGRKYRGS